MTPYMLNTIDFTMAGTINKPKLNNGKLEIMCGGLTILNKNFFEDEISRKSVFTNYSDNMYLAGIGKFTFVDILSYSVNNYNESGLIEGVTLKLYDNKAAESYIVAVFNDIALYNGEIPVGETIDITVCSTNMFEFSFNDKDLVSAKEFCKNPQQYAWYNNLGKI